MHAQVIETITGRVGRFLDGLDSGQRAQVLLPFAGELRRDWHYTPRQRPGLPLRGMSERQRALAHALLEATLSEEGYAKAVAIIGLEEVLRLLGGSPGYRDPLNYAFAVFGRPGGDAPWGWRVEGHHLSIHVTLLPPDRLAVRPVFLGANPALVPVGERKGQRTLAAEEDLARAIVQGLDEEDRRLAVIAPEAPPDIITGPGREASLRTPEGLPLSRLNQARRDAVMDLIAAYARTLRSEIALAEIARVREAGVERLHLAWAGELEPGRPHYYRLHGPTTLIEYDKIQDNANHIHTVWHDLERNWGQDLLRRHYEEGHGDAPAHHAHAHDDNHD